MSIDAEKISIPYNLDHKNKWSQKDLDFLWESGAYEDEAGYVYILLNSISSAALLGDLIDKAGQVCGKE
jgi:hypothetical protein